MFESAVGYRRVAENLEWLFLIVIDDLFTINNNNNNNSIEIIIYEILTDFLP